MIADNVVGRRWFQFSTADSATSTAVILWKAGVKSATVTHDEQRRSQTVIANLAGNTSGGSRSRAAPFRRPHHRANHESRNYDDISCWSRPSQIPLVEIMLRPTADQRRSWEFWRGGYLLHRARSGQGSAEIVSLKEELRS